MKKIRIRPIQFILYLGVTLLCNLTVVAQRECGTVEYENALKERSPQLFDKDNFEEWLKSKIIEKKKFEENQAFRIFSVKEPVLTIPVVVHVIHNGELQGVGSNISNEQINSQIVVLNEDFRRLNADASQTFPIFQSVAADIQIEFILARQDPEGLATTGIVRVQGARSSWSMFSNDMELKATSYWPAEDYMNIWVTNLSGNVIGYAQLPVSNLEGLEDSSNNRLTDGIVIGYQYFGSIDIDPTANLEAPWNLGRTATHEVGHFLGLRHIWGDCTCCEDYVEDTPTQSNSTTGCPSSKDSCDATQAMFQNYMDYTDDRCMNIFSVGQKDRTRVVIESSPRRMSLPSSHGLNSPMDFILDLGIKEIIEPVNGICTSQFTPSIDVRNYGMDLVSSATFEIWINNILVESRNEILNLLSLEEQTVLFEVIDVPGSGQVDFDFRIISVNGISDENPDNDIKSSQIVVPVFLGLPFTENFEFGASDWSIRNEDGQTSWELKQSASSSADNSAMWINLKNYQSLGEIDMLISPQFDLSSASSVDLIFDRSYAYAEGFNNDRLKVAVSTDCGNTFESIIYDVSGWSLGTTDPTSLEFLPSDRTDWLRESINMNLFAGESGIQIAFIAINGGGNNFFIDNVSVVSTPFTDAGLRSLQSPGYIFCQTDFRPIITVENLGVNEINEMDIIYSINGGPPSTETFLNLNLESGKIIDLELAQVNSSEEVLDFTFDVLVAGDIMASNNTYSREIRNSCYQEISPLREGFDNFGLNDSHWIGFDPDSDNVAWKSASTSNPSIVLENYGESILGLKDYFYSPLIDLTETTEASFFFDVSYAGSVSANEQLEIRLSDDKGLSYPYLIYEKSGSDFSVTNSSNPWFPSSDLDWVSEYVSLSEFSGQEIILAFEVTGMGINNMYIDNLEFYSEDNPDPLVFENELRVYPNPADGGLFNLTFNLLDKEDIEIVIYDVIGNEVFRRSYPNTLNQTYPFDLTGNMDGIYLIKTVGEGINSTQRIFINP